MNDAVVPLVCLAAGYVFLRRWNRTRYRWDALEWEHNLFNSALTGAGLFVFVRFLWKVWDIFFSLTPPASTVRHLVADTFPLPYACSLLGTVALAFVVPPLLNRHYEPDECIREAVDRYCGELLSLLQHAGLYSLPVMLTMENGKVYVGFVHAPPAPKYPYTRILPTISGYRDEGTKRVEFTTEYRRIYREIEEGEPDPQRRRKRIGDFCIVLPISRICSAHLFDDDTYKKHFRPRTEEASAG